MSKVEVRTLLVKLFLFVAIPMIAIGCGTSSPSEGINTDTPTTGDGEILYAQYCSSCHGFDQGGDIRDIPPPHNSNGHTWHHPDQQLIELVLDGLNFAVEGQQTMPAFGDLLNDSEVRAILDYVKTWWTQEQRDFQATVTAEAQQ